MQKELISTGKTVDEAIENGLSQLNLTRDDVEIEVIEASNKGLFGIIGQKDAKVLIKVNEDENVEADENSAIVPVVIGFIAIILAASLWFMFRRKK